MLFVSTYKISVFHNHKKRGFEANQFQNGTSVYWRAVYEAGSPVLFQMSRR